MFTVRKVHHRRLSEFTKILSLRTLSDVVSNKNPSYFHQTGKEPLKHLTIGQVLKESAEKFPARESVVSCGENSRLTFSETLLKADRLASGLLNLGLEKGDSVGLWSPNFEFWYVSMLAIARAGLVMVSLNPAYQHPELKYCIKKVNIKAIIAPESFRKQKHYEMLTTFLSGSDKICLENIVIHSDKKLTGAIQYEELLKSSSESDVADIEKLQTSISPDSVSNIQFSSGTTGQPKAAMLTHFGMVNNAYFIGIRQELHKNYRRILLNTPFFHVYGTTAGIMNSMTHGSTLVLPAPHFNPEDSLKATVREKCDVIFATPTMFVDLVNTQRKLNVKLPPVEFANTGGSIITPELVKEVEKVLNVKHFRSIYGLTEMTAAAFQSLPSDENESIQEFVGSLLDHSQAKIVDESGKVVPFGQPGELCLKGYHVMMGYYGDEKKTKETFDEEKWLKTGDQFVLYENGYAKVVGRLKEMIIRGGENLFPREIEDFINTHPNILETHVIGVPDERMGEEVGAFVRLKNSSKPLNREDVKAFCKGKLSHFKIPRYVVVVEEFPRTISGKVQKFKFLDVFADKLKDSQN